MPLKSWAFECDGRPVRVEIGWRFTGRTAKRLYVDHRFVTGRRGRFTWGRPMAGRVGPPDATGPVLEVRFRPRRLGLDMGCTVTVDGRVLDLDERSVRVEKRWQFEDEQDRPGPGLAVLVLLPLLFVLAVLYGPLAMVGQAVVAVSERRHRARLRRQSRVLDWPAVEARARSSPGTLILEAGNLAPLRAWWTPDSVRSASPLPTPRPSDVMHPGGVDHPFVDWCRSRYLAEKTGTAFLTDLPAHRLARLDLLDDDPVRDWQADHPAMSVVVTGYVPRRRWAAADRFAGLLGDTLVDSLPDLIAALDDADPALRRLCRDALRQAGPAAAAAVPALVRQLYFGPWDERWSAARTLTHLGPDGVAAVRAAESVGDPQIKGAAKPARHLHDRRSAPPRYDAGPSGPGPS